MKKQFTAFLFVLPVFACANTVVTTPSLSILQNQLSQLQQQVQSGQQTLQAVTQNLNDVTGQITALQTQVNQYGNVNASQFKWVDVANNQLPPNAFVAVSNKGSALYICQAPYSNGSGYYGGGNGNNVIDPGVVTPKGCVITNGGQSYLVPQYSVLTSNVSGYWISGEYVKSNNTQPPIMYAMATLGKSATQDATSPSAAPAASNEPTPLYNALAIIGGQENGSNVYICRVQINGQFFVGKSVNNTCYIAAGKYEANWPVYEVLLTRKP